MSANLQAAKISDLITANQLICIRALAAAAHIDPDKECLEKLGVDLRTLNQKTAAQFIGHLKALTKV